MISYSHGALDSIYKERFSWSKDAHNFSIENLENSRNLFTNESIIKRLPVPKYLEVYCLISGLPFESNFIDKLIEYQTKIARYLQSSLHYMVKPQNLAIEYAVAKWPDDVLDRNFLKKINNFMDAYRFRSYKLEIHGFQIHEDGCLVAKGFSENDSIYTFREKLFREIHGFPIKQSTWCHVPLGRVLEPCRNSQEFRELVQLANKTQKNKEFWFSTEVLDIKLIHEKQWYMNTTKQINISRDR